MNKLSEGDFLAILKRNSSTKYPECYRTDELLKSMKEVYNAALDLAAENARTIYDSPNDQIVDKESILNLKIE